jgi:antitoxin YefM
LYRIQGLGIDRQAWRHAEFDLPSLRATSWYACCVTVLPFTDARNRLSELIDEVQRTHERVEITRHGRAVAVLVSPDDLAALEETLEVLTNRDLMRQLAESREAVDAGDVLDAEDLAALMAKRARDTERPRAR